MILVCGEALVDVFVGEAEEAGGARLPAEIVAGGSPFNVALGVAPSRRARAFLGGLSRDSFGAHLRCILEREGVDLSLAPSKTNPTTMSVVARGPDGQPATPSTARTPTGWSRPPTCRLSCRRR